MLGALLLLGALHISGCGDDGDGGSGGGGGQPGTTSSGTTGSVTSGGPDGTTSASTAGTGGASTTSSSSTSAGTGGGGEGGSGDGGAGGEPTPPVDSGLPTPPGADNVAKPSGAVGGLKVIDWAGFAGAVTYSFDDVNQTQIQNYDALNALGVPFTFYVWTGKNEANNPVWTKALMDGHELGNHTKSHSSNDNGSDTDAATQFIKDKWSVTPYTMAAPNGSDAYVSISQSRFLINRGVSNALISPNDSSNPFKLPTYIPPQNASTAQMDAEVTSARTGKKWRTFCIHGFTGGSDGAYQPIPLNAFLEHVKHVKDFGDVWIGTMETIGAYWRGQKAVSDADSTQAGGATTYTWQLPANFPPGKYVRVTVTGGTPKQNGAALPWNPHGYYEVALDAKSLTLSP
ncbi:MULTISPECIES: polysaccharide deacetylase family protein [Sorangium]|uniref:polysaccharide deacetylase family protein n=1 Tax=Sorangium TaxID=39643 RepID=UPI00101A8B08|nr:MULTISPECIES: polysaccharide deacetylase family protein [Sorangium]